jgi:hypothetical protein
MKDSAVAGWKVWWESAAEIGESVWDRAKSKAKSRGPTESRLECGPD